MSSRILAVPLAFAAVMLSAACGGEGDDELDESSVGASAPLTAPAASSTAPPSSVPQAQGNPTAGTPVRIAIGNAVITGRLNETATARDLLTQLPLSLSFRDLNNVEKIARLPRPLSMDGVPNADDPEIGDIGYYAPSQDLVLYYGDVGNFPGIVRIGRFDGDPSRIARQPDGLEATVEVAT